MDVTTFKLKVELLFKGLRIEAVLNQNGRHSEDPDLSVDVAGTRSMEDVKSTLIDKVARKGGAGPAGGMFIKYHDFFIANVPMQEQMIANSDLVIDPPPDAGPFKVYKDIGSGVHEDYVRLFKIPAPSFYDELYMEKARLSIVEPIPFKKIALVHGADCVATTINQTCKYWRQNKQCSFCAIEESLKSGQTLAKKTPDQLIAFVERARDEHRVKHYTLTSGTQDGPDGGAMEYIPFVKALKEQFKYPVHVQIAPVRKLEFLDKLYYAGVDNIGIHVEVFPDSLRRQVCPGKAEIPLSRFEKNWDYAVDLFGSEQVESYVLVGMGEDFTEFKAGIELLIEHEVIPFVVPARPIKNTSFQKNLLEDYEALVKYYKYAGTRLHEQGLRPWKARAGCVRCGACSAIKESTKIAEKFE
ncbi:MAG: radical SAM protein [Promethearchaeota archaeon]